MSNPFKTAEFKKLFKEWNKILEANGHEEIEDFNLPETPLKAWHALKWNNEAGVLRAGDNQSYYDQAHTVLNSYKFDGPIHKRIWTLHCEGKSVRQITEEVYTMAEQSGQLCFFFGKRNKKTTIHAIIVGIQKKTGIWSE